MGMFLNSRVPYDAYQVAAAGRYFMDKTALLPELFLSMNTTERFLCITRPRRFGKSVMANMVGAFFGKAEDSRQIFSQLEIATDPNFERHLNREMYHIRCVYHKDPGWLEERSFPGIPGSSD